MIYVLKGTGVLAATAVAELVAQGQMAVAVAAAPMLVTMWYATRLFARRRRARGGGP